MAKHAVATAFISLLNPGDEVLVPAPYWTTYPESVYLTGATPVPVMSSEANGFRITVEELERARTPRTKMLIFNSPTNPTGAVAGPDEVAAIGRWAAENDIWVLSDEIYEHLVYGDAHTVSLPVVSPELGDRWIVVNGVAKSYAMTGWRVGWMISAPDMMDAAFNYQSQTTSNISNISQRAAVAALTGDLMAVAEMREVFDRRRKTMVEMLNEIDGVSCAEPEGAFYGFPNVTGFLGDRSGSRRELLERVGGAAARRDPDRRRSGRSLRRPGLLATQLRARATTTSLRDSNAGGTSSLRAESARSTRSLFLSRERCAVARVLVTEEIAESGLQKLRNAGHEVDVQLGLTPAQLLEAVPGAHALIIRSATQVDAATLEAASDLVVVGRAGIGLDNVDVARATELGVMVVNAPVSNILSAAEQTMALLLAQARNIPQAHAALKNGKWERSKWEGVELHGKTLGVVGLGKIGALVAQRANAFGMRLIAYDPFITEERARHMGVELVDLDTLLAQSDFITIHLPKNKETTGFLNKESFTKVKPSVRIINVARGGIVNEADLADAIREGKVQGAALDVFEKEPTTESPLFELPSVVVVPHLGASTFEAQDKAGVTIAEQVELALAGDFVPYAVNVSAGEVSNSVSPFMGLAEVLGRFIGGLLDGEPANLTSPIRVNLLVREPKFSPCARSRVCSVRPA